MGRREFLQIALLAASTSVAVRQTTRKRSRAIVIGAGISGLVAALGLRNAGTEVTVLEASPRPGGRIGTLHQRGPRGLLMAYAYEDLARQIGAQNR